MGITSLIGKLFGADVAPPPDARKLDGTTEAALARSLSALPPDERGWITFAEARFLFSTKGDQYAFGETDDDALVRLTSTNDGKHLRANMHNGRRSRISQLPLPRHHSTHADAHDD
jgi:hypothetical protein